MFRYLVPCPSFSLIFLSLLFLFSNLIIINELKIFQISKLGLVIGGKDFNAEQKRIANMNILVCTPGRLLQHMDQTPLFDCTNLQALGMLLTILLVFQAIISYTLLKLETNNRLKSSFR